MKNQLMRIKASEKIPESVPPDPEKNAPDRFLSNRLLWDKIGFHRALGGFWNNLIYQLGIILIPSIVAIYLFKWMYPFPESIGYRDAFSSIFVFIFNVFDLGTAAVISRYIADENIKNPENMIKYIQYFIWYQAITGLIQITGVSIWALYFASNTLYAYGIYIMLVCVTKQWPGFPGVFKGVLNALQMFNKRNAIEFIQNEGIQTFTEIAFVFLGKWYGSTHPAVGPILGIAIGATFGLYFDDIIASFFAAYVLAKGLKPYGISFKRLFMVEFDVSLVKECFVFGIKMGFPGVLSALTKLYSLTLLLSYMPQYTTFATLANLAFMLMATTDRMVYQDFTPLFTEAYQNGKIKLCQYYNSHAIRFLFINTGFSVSIMLTFITIFPNLFEGIGLYRYMLTIPFLIPALLARALYPYIKYPGTILTAAHKPSLVLLLNGSMELLKLLGWFMGVRVFRIYELGISGIAYTILLTEFPVNLLKIALSMLYIHKKIFPIKVYRWQSLFVPAAATSVLYGIFTAFRKLVLDSLWGRSFWGATLSALLVIIVLVIFFYFPLTVLLGGWDVNSIADMEKAAKMSGPSKIFTVPMVFLIKKAVRISPLHNRFKIAENGAFDEVNELMLIRDMNRELLRRNP